MKQYINAKKNKELFIAYHPLDLNLEVMILLYHQIVMKIQIRRLN